MIDTHCHIDLYPNPLNIINDCEKLKIKVISMTNLPSHFEIAYPYFLNKRYCRLSLGYHPLKVNDDIHEFDLFIKNIQKTSYIGEVGLDFSKQGINNKKNQILIFEKILTLLKDKKKIISLHSRNAEEEVFFFLRKHFIKNAIFHWYTGKVGLIDIIADNNYYFSINYKMTISKKGQEIINRIPLKNILTETDGPFVNLEDRIIHPCDINKTIKNIASIKNIPQEELELIIQNNTKRLFINIK